jgi:hypothetical protein
MRRNHRLFGDDGRLIRNPIDRRRPIARTAAPIER